ncbi:MAG: ABC transporter permease [Muribaculaceae bacterium]|nr:ABC transporter permease [Muribaculaceae bacterium]
MFDLAREIGQSLSNNKLRTALTGLSVAWGIFMLIILLSMSHGVTNSFKEKVMSRGSNYISIYPGHASKAHNGLKVGRYIDLKEEDLSTITSTNGNYVESASSTVYGPSLKIHTPKDYITEGYQGVFPEQLKKRGIPLYAGRFINQADLDHKRKVVVLTKQNASILFDSVDEAIGKTVNIGNISFTVVGIIDPEYGRNTYIPFTTAKALTGNDPSISEISVVLKNVKTEQDGEYAEDGIRETLSRAHNFDKDDDGAVWIWNQFKQQLQMGAGMWILELAMWIIGLFTMLSGIIGVSNIMFVSVKERTHEIGIRRAIGAKPHNILTQIITESVAITAMFGYIGVFLGVLIMEVINRVIGETDFMTNARVDISIAIKVTIVLIIAGCLAGLFPALKALKVKPVEALRDE